jgi:hypothetical protein
MTYIYVLAIVAIGLYLGRNYIKGFILKRKDKKNEKLINNDFVYRAIKGSRTFQFTLKIDEIGDGEITLDIVKQK